MTFRGPLFSAMGMGLRGGGRGNDLGRGESFSRAVELVPGVVLDRIHSGSLPLGAINIFKCFCCSSLGTPDASFRLTDLDGGEDGLFHVCVVECCVPRFSGSFARPGSRTGKL